jgi:hypothetical protein
MVAATTTTLPLLKLGLNEFNQYGSRERVDTTLLAKLINSTLVSNEEERKQLEMYMNLYMDNPDGPAIRYSLPDGIVFGRLVPEQGLGLSAFRKEILHTLAKGTYTLVEMDNFYPWILYQVCKQNKVKCEKLEDYILHRENHLASVMKDYNVDHDTAEKLFTKYFLDNKSFHVWKRDAGLPVGIGTKQPTLFMQVFRIELQDISKVIKRANPLLLKATEYQKGSLLSHYLQEIETRILGTCMRYIHSIDHHVVITSCGLLLPSPLLPGVLDKLQELVHTTFNMEIIFLTKNLDADYLDILDNHIMSDNEILSRKMGGGYIVRKIESIDEVVEFSTKKMEEYFFDDLEQLDRDKSKYMEFFQYTNSFKYFDTFHMYISSTNDVYKISKIKNEITSYNHFKENFPQLYFVHETREMRFASMYFKSKYKKCYDTFYFDPNENSPAKGMINNLFTGFKYASVVARAPSFAPDVVKVFTDNVNYICNDEKPVAEYLLSWFAHIIQRPHIKTNMAPVIIARDSACVDIVCDVFKKLLDYSNVKFRDVNMEDKLFVVGRKVNDKIHDAVVQQEDRLGLNNKSVVVQDLRNYLFIVKERPVGVKCGSFIVIESRIVERTTKKYRESCQERYNLLIEIKNDEGKMKCLYNFLKTFDISKFDPKIRPDEIGKKRITDNLIPYIRFVVDEIETLSSKKDWRIPELYQMSIKYSKGNNYTERWFAMQFKKAFREFQMLNKNRQSVYNFSSNVDIIKNAIENHFSQK